MWIACHMRYSHIKTFICHWIFCQQYFSISFVCLTPGILQELLALEDHIGNVSTGLSEEAAIASLKRSNYFLLAEENAQKDFCSICQVFCLYLY